jgi:hypothetical protein
MRWGTVAGGGGVTALVVGALMGVLTAGAGTPDELRRTPDRSCGARVVDDWADDGWVQGRYTAACYRAAIADLPEDLRAYSTAGDDLERALQQALRAE